MTSSAILFRAEKSLAKKPSSKPVSICIYRGPEYLEFNRTILIFASRQPIIAIRGKPKSRSFALFAERPMIAAARGRPRDLYKQCRTFRSSLNFVRLFCVYFKRMPLCFIHTSQHSCFMSGFSGSRIRISGCCRMAAAGTCQQNPCVR